MAKGQKTRPLHTMVKVERNRPLHTMAKGKKTTAVDGKKGKKTIP